MKIWKFLAIFLSFLVFVDLFALMLIIMKLNFSSLLLDNKFIVQIFFFVGGAYIAGAFYKYLKGTKNEGTGNQKGYFEVTRDKLIAIGIVIFIPLFSVICLYIFD